jgi:hypothetical protein
MQIAADLLPSDYELVTAPHGTPEFWNLLKDAEFYIGAGQYKHGPEFYAQAPKLRLVQTLSAGYNTYDLDAARGAGVPGVGAATISTRPNSMSSRTRCSALSVSAISAPRSRAAPRRSTCGSSITTSTG